MLKFPGGRPSLPPLPEPPHPEKNPSISKDSRKTSTDQAKAHDPNTIKRSISRNRRSAIEKELRKPDANSDLITKTSQLSVTERKSENITPSIINLVRTSRLPETEKNELITHIGNRAINFPEKLKIDFLMEKLTVPPTGEPALQLSEAANKLRENKERLSPTAAWIKKYNEDLNSAWDEDCYSKLPCRFEKLIDEETKYLDTHVPFYHAHKDTIHPCQALMEALIQSATKDITENQWPKETQWCRNPFETPRGKICKNANDMKEMLLKLTGKDNSDIGKWHMLSCNPSFFQNTNRDAMESTADYLHDNNSVEAPKDKDFFNDLLNNADLLMEPSSQQTRADLYQELQKIYQEAGDDKKGVLWQIFVPHQLVDHVAYVAGDNGIPDSNNKNTLETLLQLQLQHKKADSELPKNHKTLQLRLSTSLMHDPTISPQLIIKKYGPLPEKNLIDFKQKISTIATDIITRSLQEQLQDKEKTKLPETAADESVRHLNKASSPSSANIEHAANPINRQKDARRTLYCKNNESQEHKTGLTSQDSAKVAESLRAVHKAIPAERGREQSVRESISRLSIGGGPFQSAHAEGGLHGGNERTYTDHFATEYSRGSGAGMTALGSTAAAPFPIPEPGAGHPSIAGTTQNPALESQGQSAGVTGTGVRSAIEWQKEQG